MLKEGEVLKERYRVTQLIGKGGMSKVYLATDIKLHNKLWAIKEVDRKAKDPTGRPIEQSLILEANLLSQLDHPMIVDIVDTITTTEYIYVVMDYVEGKSLDKVVREEGPQSEEDVQNWMIQICDALNYLHNQDPPIIYRDMKPANIMLRPDGYVKLIDLGVARRYKDYAKKDTIAFGTEGYAPPEQRGSSQTDRRADIYALGATMWHLLTGEAPQEYPLPNIRTRNPKVREGFANVIVPKCCQLDKEFRYQNCDELVADLELYNELTREYFDEQKKKVNIFTRLIAGGIACIIAGFILLGVNTIIVEQNYSSQKAIAQDANNDFKVRETAWIEAINCKPWEREPYEMLINLYQNPSNDNKFEDSVLNAQNTNTINELIKKHEGDLKRSSLYGLINYLLGKAVWDNYDDGSNNSNVVVDNFKITKAAPFFKIANENMVNGEVKENCMMYLNIVNFIEQFEQSSADEDGTGISKNTLMDECLSSLTQLAKNLKYTNSSKVKLNSYTFIANFLYGHANDFPNYVSNYVINELEREVDAGLSQEFSFSSDSKYVAALQQCKNTWNNAKLNVATKYKGSVGGK